MLKENLRHIFSSISISKFPLQIFLLLLCHFTPFSLSLYSHLISNYGNFLSIKAISIAMYSRERASFVVKMRWKFRVNEGKLEDKRNLSLMLSHCIKISFKIMLQTRAEKNVLAHGVGVAWIFIKKGLRPILKWERKFQDVEISTF